MSFRTVRLSDGTGSFLMAGVWRRCPCFDLSSLLAVLILLFTALGVVPAQASSEVYIADTILVSSKVVSSTQTDYTYSVRVLNRGAALTGTVVNVTSRSSNCRVIDGEALLGDVPRGTTVKSTDTVTIRRSRPGPPTAYELSWAVRGNPGNSAPVAHAGPDQTARLGTVVTLDGTGSTDADGDRLYYRWQLVAKPTGSTARLSSTTVARPTFTVDKRGTYVFRLSVSDDGRDYDERGRHCRGDEVRVSTTNSAPVADAGADRTAARGSTIVLDGSASRDPDLDALTYAWRIVAAPSGSVARLSNATVSKPSVTLDKPGDYRFSLVVSDATSSSDPDEVVITTENSAPVANAGADQTARIGYVVTLDGSGSTDADNDALSFDWSWVSMPAGSRAVLQTADQPQASFTPDAGGLYVVQLIVNDGFADSVPDTITVTIDVPVNRPPTANPDGATTPQDTPITINVLANDTDPDLGATLSIASFTQPPSGGAVSQTGGSLRFAPSAGFIGTAAFTYTVTDGQFTSTASVSVQVTAVASNIAPTVNAGADRVIFSGFDLPNASVLLTGTVSDDGLPKPATLTDTWSKVSGPGTVTFSAGNAASTSATFDALGTYVLRLTASDGALTTSDDLQVTVQAPANTGPVLSAIANRTQGVGTALSLLVTANDNNPLDTLTFSLTSAPAGAVMTPQGRLSWTPTTSQLGARNFTVTVRDAGGLSDSKSFVITVVAQNHAPVLSALSDDTTSVGASYVKTLNATDSDGDALSFELISGPTGLSLAGATVQWVPGAAQLGAATVKVRVRDTAGASSLGLFTVTVLASGAPIARDDVYSVKVGQTLAVPAAGVLDNDYDPNGGVLSAARRSTPGVGTLTSFGSDGSFTYQAPATNPRPAFTVVSKPLTTQVAPYQFPNDLGPSSSPLVGDINHDGKPDLIFGGQGGPLLAISGGDGHMLWQNAGIQGGCSVNESGGSPQQLLGDIDDDGQVEVVATAGCLDAAFYRHFDRLMALKSDGSIKWLSEPLFKQYLELQCAFGNNSCPPSPSVVSFDVLFNASISLVRLGAGEAPVILARGDVPATAGYVYNELTPGNFGAKYYGCKLVTGLDEDMGKACDFTMFISPVDGHVIQVLRSPYREVLNRGAPIAPFWHNPPLAADLDGDGEVEIVSGADVWKRSGGQWSLAWQLDVEPEQVAIADLDGDGRPELVYGVDRTNGAAGSPLAGFSGIMVYNGSGQELRRIPLPTYFRFPGLITIADIDGDQVPEFLWQAGGTVYAISAEGEFRWAYQVPDNPAYPQAANVRTQYRGNVAIYDLDGDGNAEAIFSTTSGTVILDARTGAQKVLLNGGIRPSNFKPSAVFVADWDNDGHADIIDFTQGGASLANPGAVLLTATNNDWLPAPTSFNQTLEQTFSLDAAGRALFDPAVKRSYRNPAQMGTVRDPRASAGTSFDYVANNGRADSAIAKVFVTIAPPNSPPAFTSRPPTVMQADGPSPFVYRATAVDPDAGDTITYSANVYGSNGFSGPPYVTIDPATGVLSMLRSPSYGVFTLLITVVATDSQGESSSQTFVIKHETAAPVAVPNVVGSALPAAVASLDAAALQSSVLQRQYSTQPEGTVIAQSPAAASTQPRGTVILLTVSKGLAPVVVPNVVGKSLASASAVLGSNGFTVSITRVYSTTIPSGQTISQDPAAGGETVPGAAMITVSLGSGLNVKLSRDYTNANIPITATVYAVSLDGVESVYGGATLGIATAGVTAGSAPGVAGSTITPAANTQGTYRVTATDALNGRVGTATFVVTAPASADTNVEAAAFANLSVAIADVANLMSAAQAAGRLGDQATMVARTKEAVTRWRAMDQTTLRLSTPFSPLGGIPPRVSDMAGFGITPIPDDLLNTKVLENGVSAVQALIDGLRASNTPYAQLNNLLDGVSTAIAPLPTLAPSEYGFVQAQPEYAYLGSILIPDWMDALMNDMARATGLPATASNIERPVGANEQSVYICSTLAEGLTTLAVNAVLEQINVLQSYERGIMQQATSGALLVTLASHLRSALRADQLDSVVAGSSLSILSFRQPYSMIEGNDFEEKYPILNDVVFLGPDTVSLVGDILDIVRTGTFNNTADATKVLSFLFSKLKSINVGGDPTNPLAGVNDALSAGSQPTHDSSRPCIFSPDPRCVELLYPTGFYSVYTMDPYLNTILPAQLTGLPIPIIVIARNRAGQFYLATPSFIPYREGSN